MVPRNAENTIWTLLEQFPAVALLGPRQIGKSTLARTIAARRGQSGTYILDLERPQDRAQIQEPELFFRAHQNQLVILDEIQRVPDMFATLKSIIDERRVIGKRAGHFLLLGSASIDLLKQSAETLAGRIAYHKLAGFSLDEVRNASPNTRTDMLINTLWLRGGFPDSYLATDDASSTRWRESFVQTYLERDIPALGPRIPSETLQRFWTMLAHRQGAIRNAAQLANSLDLSGQTVARYTDLLADLLLLRVLAPWHHNIGKRLVKSPKLYLRDAGITHALLGITTVDELLAHPVAGMSWEGFVIEEVLAHAQDYTPYHYRTATGVELDLVLERGNRRIACEIKRTLTPSVSAGFCTASEDVQATERYIIYPGERRFPLGHNTEALPLANVPDLFSTPAYPDTIS